MTFGRNALIAVVILWTSVASADDWTIDVLAMALQKNDTHQVAFTEYRHISYLSAPLIARGTMDFTDGVLRKDIIAPQPERFEIRENFLIHIDNDDNVTRIKIEDHPVVHSLVITLRATLSGQFAPLRDYFNLVLSGSRADWEMAMYPHTEKLRASLSAVTLRGVGGRLTEIAIAELNGDNTVIKVQND